MSTDVTEGTCSPTQLTFTRDNWDQKQRVKVTGVDDPDADDDMAYHIKFFNITSDDSDYNSMEADSAAGININDLSHKNFKEIGYTLIDIDKLVTSKVMTKISQIDGVISIKSLN